MGETTAALVRLLAGQGQHIEEQVRDTHTAIADRVFRALGPLGAPVRGVHDAVGQLTYDSVARMTGAAGEVAATAALRLDDGLVMQDPRGVQVVGAVLGLAGDWIRTDEPEVDWPTQLRSPDGHLLGSHDEGISGVLDPVRTRTVIVLLHGLCETEHAWSWGTEPGRPSLPGRLQAPDRTVLLARVNSGRRPAETGREVADLIDAVVDDRTSTVVLVGHSMGGLVARAAIRSGRAAGHRWVEACGDLVTLGTPHLGAPLEKAVAALVRAGALAREVDAITRWFEQRSDGIRDLRHGAATDDAAPGAPVSTVPLPEHVRLHTVGAAFEGTIGVVLGDGLVRRRPAHDHGRGADRASARGPQLHLDGRSHFDLLVDPKVGMHVRRVVDEAAARTEP